MLRISKSAMAARRPFLILSSFFYFSGHIPPAAHFIFDGNSLAIWYDYPGITHSKDNILFYCNIKVVILFYSNSLADEVTYCAFYD